MGISSDFMKIKFPFVDRTNNCLKILLITLVCVSIIPFHLTPTTATNREPESKQISSSSSINITNVFHYPTNPQVNEMIYVFADVTSTTILPKVWVYYRIPGTELDNWLGTDMKECSLKDPYDQFPQSICTNNTYFSQVHLYHTGGVVEEYYIKVDSTIENNNGEYYKIHIGHNTTPPEITDVYHTPAIPQPGDETTVYANVSDASGLSSVVIYYQFNGGNWQNKSMLSYQNTTYRAFIGVFNSGDSIFYYITATDKSPHNITLIEDNGGKFYTIGTIPTSAIATPFLNHLLLTLTSITLVLIIRRRKRTS